MAKKEKTSSKRNSIREIQEINWAGHIKPSLRFSIIPKRFLPFLFSDLAAVLVVMMMAVGNASIMELAITGQALPAEAVSFLATSVVIFGLWMVVNIWITGAVIHQTRKPGEYKKSWSVGFKSLPNLLLALIIITVVAFAASSVPYVGTFLSFIIAMMFLFVNHYIVLDTRGFWKSIVSSVMTFRKKLPSVFMAWLFTIVISGVIVGLFTVPLVLYLFAMGADYTEAASLDALLTADAPALYAVGFLLMAGITISRVFTLKYLTEIYLQFKRKKWLS
jgi:hypothetical protein